MLLLTAVLAVALLVLALLALTRDLRNAGAWKRDEPVVCRAIEQTTGQRIGQKLLVNASLTEEFSPRTVFWLWLGFTRDYLVLVQRDQPVGEGEARTVLAERKNVSARRLSKRFLEITLSGSEDGEPLIVHVCVRPRDTAMLERMLKIRSR